ncbi:hypothetical protein HYU19_05485 [Candidatus Woesearchaeota archaeon]|nr:hypothetical protein [Candidatus Woesearchaeota archaeon]
MANKLVAVWCVYLLLFSIVASASLSSSDDSLSRVLRYQKLVDEAGRAGGQDAVGNAGSSSSQQDGSSPLPPVKRPAKRLPPSLPGPFLKDPVREDPPDEEPAGPSPSLPRPSTPEAPSGRPSRPKYESSDAPASEPSRPDYRFSGGMKEYCDPVLPRWMCDEKADRDPDETVQKILEWKQARDADAADVPVGAVPETVPLVEPAIFRYDANGNLVDDETLGYQYNSFNQLAFVVDKASGLVVEEYEYDQNGDRIQKTVYADGLAAVTYYLDDYSITVNSDGNVTEQTRIYHDGQLVGMKENGRMRLYHPDHLGSSDVVTNGDGVVVERVDYTPFGVPLTATRLDYLYTGKELDDSGLMYYGARYYNPLHARFTQPDSVIADAYDPQNLNRYSYVLNNPYKYVDPEGNTFWDVIDVGFAVTDITSFIDDPSWESAGWAALSLVSLLPVLPNIAGYIRYGDKAVEAGKAANAAEKAGDAAKMTEGVSNVVHLSKNAKILRDGPSRTTVTVRSFDEAEQLLHEAFPGYKKVTGNSPKFPRSSERQALIKEQLKQPGSYHMDYQYMPDGSGKIHDTGSHSELPHINVYTQDKRHMTIIIDKLRVVK